MSARNEDFLFAQEAEKLGYISEQQVEEAFLLQRRMAEDLKIDERLAVILVKRGWLAEEQARRVYAIIEPKGASQQIEGYRLVAKIGRGAMGTVYKAIHERLNRPVAIKILRRDLATDKTQIERLKGEAQLLASLDHPNIVRAIDAGESNGFPYFVMEYVEGENLRDAIIRKGAFDEDEALRITRDLANALERARRMGVVHRDVKPGNVILTRRGSVPKLMDLGLAKGPIDLGLTQHGATVGTPQFISPEQAQDPKEADTRSDIYSLGATLYAMLTSRPPFEGATLAEIITKVLYEQPTPLRVLNDDVSPEVSYLVERMMLKDSSLRHRTPADVAEDIDRIKGGQSIVPQGFTGNWEAFLLRRRMKRWVRRGLVAGVALVLLSVGTFFYVRHKDRQDSLAQIAKGETEVLGISLSAFEQPLHFSGTTMLHRLASLRAEASGRASEVRRAYERAEGWRGFVQSHEEVADTEGPRHEEVRGHLDRLAELLADYEALGELGTQLMTRFPDDVAAQDFAKAYADVEAARERRAGRQDSPAVAALDALGRAVVEESGQVLYERVLHASTTSRLPSTLEELDQIWDACYRDLDSGRFYGNQNLRTLKTSVEGLVAELARISSGAAQMQGGFEAATVARRVAANDIEPLLADYRQQRQDLERDVADRLRPFAQDKLIAVGANRLLDEGRPLYRQLEMIRATINGAVQARTTTLLEQVQAELDRTPFDPKEVKSLIEQLGRWSRAIESEYDELARQTNDAWARAVSRNKEYLDAFQAYFVDSRTAAFGSLIDGKPGELLKLLDGRIAERDPKWGADKRLDQLRWAGQALSELQDRALDAVEKRLADGKSRFDDVRLRAGVDARWKVLEVDREHRVFQVEIRARGGRPVKRAVPVSEIHPAQLLAFVGAAPSPRIQAAAALSAMRPAVDKPGIDLRPLRDAWRRTREAFEAISGDEELAPWVEFVTAQYDDLAGWQERREANARTVEIASRDYYENGKFVEARDRLDLLLKRDRSLRYTDVFDELQLQIEERSKKVDQALERNEWLALFPGARLKAAENRVLSVIFDWDTPEFQKKNILHGYGEFEREPAAEGPQSTPNRSAEPRRLHLLKGETTLVKDRPLAFPQFFDPGTSIEFEAKIHTLEGSFLLAIDIDGVKVAVCSADPRLYDRRFGRDTPLLDDESKLPEYDFYGMGRGVAFHRHAGNNFGSNFFDSRIWTWPRAGRGRNFKAWRDRKIEDPKEFLFAFERGKAYTVRAVRELDRMRLYVDGRMVAEMQEKSWGKVGTNSDIRKEMSHGTGRLQLLTWTPLIVSEITLKGTLSRRWEKDRRAHLDAEAEAKAEAERKAKAAPGEGE